MSVRKVALPVPSEDEEQEIFVGYLELRQLKFTAIPNNTYTKHNSVKTRNTRLGLRAGLCDVLVALPGIGLAFVEMKKRDASPSNTSPAQLEWIRVLNLCPGTEARVCKGARPAIRFIEELSPSRYGAYYLSDDAF